MQPNFHGFFCPSDCRWPSGRVQCTRCQKLTGANAPAAPVLPPPLLLITSVAPEPWLGSVWFGFGLSFWSKSSTQLGLIFYFLKNSANTSFLRLLKKIIGKALFGWEKFQVFLSTMPFKGHFQPKD